MDRIEKVCVVLCVLWTGFWSLVWWSDSLVGVSHYGPIIALPIVFVFALLKGIRWALD
jgi:hypothetical protein